jgi:bifunctional DNA-binding transcriptional regulator/antitoxin component of YhaV-PrlF toxin-antitoxin module
MEMIIKLKQGCFEIPKQLREQMHIGRDDEIILTSQGDQLIMKLKQTSNKSFSDNCDINIPEFYLSNRNSIRKKPKLFFNWTGYLK